MSLDGRHIFITGGARGIGLTIAQACKQAGASVTVVARTKQDLEEATRQLNKISSGRSLALQADVCSSPQIESALKSSSEELGPIFGLVCAAGVYGTLGPFAESDFALWEKTININLVGTARTIHHATKYMNLPTGGRVVLFSGGGQAAMPNFSDYVASKGAVWRLTETWGAELAAREIFVNAIAPGAVNTRLLDELLTAGPERVGSEFYNKSLQQRENGGQSPEKAAALCLYLFSDKAHGLYGKTLSAIWDNYQSIENPASVSGTDLFTYRRVVDNKGGTRG
jgi:NAD(P)-dependent dehydrogenase (short-subunit alcohol dehydrogenase family)